MSVLLATECVSPAFRHTIKQMFQPFRFSFWLRMAVLGFFTAEFGGGLNLSSPQGTARGGPQSHGPLVWPHHTGWFTTAHIIELAVAGLVFAFVLTFVYMYINSVLRFVLFDTVLHGDARIRAGWRKWRVLGLQFFQWQVTLLLLGWGVFVVCLFVPVLSLLRDRHIGFWHIDADAIRVLITDGLVFAVLAIALALAAIVAKDFLVPVMVMEHLRWQDAWKRFAVIAKGNVPEYVVYFVLKFFLRIAAGILHTIAILLVGLVLAIPLGGLVMLGIAMAAGATAAAKMALLVLAGLLLILVIAVAIAVSAFFGAPIAFFFPSYTLHFFAGQYEPLAKEMFPNKYAVKA